MAQEPIPDARPPAQTPDLRPAGEWLARNGLTDARPTPLLAIRLAARERARLAGQVLLGVLIVASTLAALSALDSFQAQRPLALAALSALVAGLLLAQALLDRWVRGVDRRTGATLSRRATHSAQPGWRDLLGRPYAVYLAATFAGGMALAGSALAVPGPTVRRLGVVLLIGLLGATAILAVQLRHLLRRPVVAEDEESLTADVIMRVEDARDLMPSVQVTLPVVLLFGFAPGWWGAAAIAYLVLSVGAFIALRFTMPSGATVARRVMGLR